MCKNTLWSQMCAGALYERSFIIFYMLIYVSVREKKIRSIHLAVRNDLSRCFQSNVQTSVSQPFFLTNLLKPWMNEPFKWRWSGTYLDLNERSMAHAHHYFYNSIVLGIRSGLSFADEDIELTYLFCRLLSDTSTNLTENSKVLYIHQLKMLSNNLIRTLVSPWELVPNFTTFFSGRIMTRLPQFCRTVQRFLSSPARDIT